MTLRIRGAVAVGMLEIDVRKESVMCAALFARKRILPLCLVAAIAIGACNSSPVTPPEDSEPPDIPPASTMVMDFSDFQEDNTPDAPKLRIISIDNWKRASGVVVVWDTILAVTLAIPVGAFVESFNHEPERQPDGSWQWSYDAVIDGSTYTAKLQAKAVGGDINWDMYITKAGVYTDVHWFSGVSNLIGTEGTWTLNRNPDNVTPFIGIDWHRSTDGQTADITYTSIVPGGEIEGSYITMAITDETPFDASYDLYDSVADELIEIEWNLADTSGRIKDSDHFGDDNWHCWDAMLQDVDCDADTNGA